MRLFTTTALAAVLALPGAAMAQTDTEGTTATGTAGTADAASSSTITAERIISLNEWRYEDIYAQAWSADDFIDEMEVYGEEGDDIGDVEDLIVNADGELVAVIAEIGGFLDIGDTHVAVPWDQVAVDRAEERVTVPLTEENVRDYDPLTNRLGAEQLSEEVAMGVDDVPTDRRSFRVSELIGDYARLQGGDGQAMDPTVDEQDVVREEVRPIREMRNYGYISDVLIQDDKIAAVVVEPRGTMGPGYYAYPYYGYDADYGWEPGDEFYDMPYTEEEVGELERFEYEQLDIVGVETETETETGAQ